MYTVNTRYRYGSQQRLTLSGGTSYPYGVYSYVPLVAAESSYSWRTGRRAKIKSAAPYKTIVRGGLIDQIRRRTEYTNSLIAEVSDAGSYNGSVAVFGNTDVGHPFAVAKRYIELISAQCTWTDSYGGTAVFDAIPLNALPDHQGERGVAGSNTFLSFPWNPSSGQSPFSPAPVANRPMTSGDITKLQQDLITGLNPYRQNNSAATAILELLKGDLPSVLGRLSAFRYEMKYLHPSDRMKLADQARRELSSPGSTDLNVRFGWAPLINDIYTLIEACLRLDSTLVERNAKRRRSHEFKKLDWYSDTQGYARNQFGFPTFGSYKPYSVQQSQPITVIGSQLLSATRLTGPGLSYAFTAGAGMEFFTQSVRWSFTARYSNGVRSNPTLDKYIGRLTELLGIGITPEVVYDLTPWTWLLDWFTSLGSTVKFLSDFGLNNNVLNYAYFTQHVTTTRGRMLWKLNSQGPLTSQGLVMVKETTKEIMREAASPLGFGVSYSALTQGQIDILIALGLLRRR